MCIFLGRRSIAFSGSISVSLAPKKLRTTQLLGAKMKTPSWYIMFLQLDGLILNHRHMRAEDIVNIFLCPGTLSKPITLLAHQPQFLICQNLGEVTHNFCCGLVSQPN